MKSFSDYPQRNRVAIVVGCALVAAGVLGVVFEYFQVPWWHRLIDGAHFVLVAAFPFAIIILAACLASAQGRSSLDAMVHPKAKRPVFTSRTDRRIAGVCGGIAASRQVKAGFVRLIVLLLFVAFPLAVIVLYVIAAFAIKPE